MATMATTTAMDDDGDDGEDDGDGDYGDDDSDGDDGDGE